MSDREIELGISDGRPKPARSAVRSETGSGDRLRQRADTDDLDVDVAVGRVRRHDGASKAEPGCFGEPARGLAHLSEFSTEADLAEHRQIRWERVVTDGAHHGEAHAEIEARFAELDPAGRGRVHVLITHGDA